MGDVDGSFTLDELIKALVNFIFRDGIECCGWLVKNHDRGVLVPRPCNGNLLGFTAGNGHAVITQRRRNRRIDGFRHTLNPVGYIGYFQGFPDPFTIGVSSSGNIFGNAIGKKPEILKNHTQKTAIFVFIVFLNVDIV